MPGDLWSYDYAKDDYYVCPEPDVHVLQINPHVHKVLILASDGLWNMLRPQDAVGCVQDVEREMERRWFKTKVSARDTMCARTTRMMGERDIVS